MAPARGIAARARQCHCRQRSSWGPGGVVYDSNATTTYTPGLSERVNGTDEFVHTDWLGSTRWMSNSTGLAFTNGLRYDGYGQKTSQIGGWHPSNLLFAGGWGYQTEYGTDVEPGLGLMYLEQRYYDPAIGRFISRDPISFAGGLNLYEYCYGDPIGLVDPFGLGPWQWYMEGMGGTSDWVDNRLMGGATARFGTTAGLHDAGCASTGQLLGAGAGWGLQLGMSGGNVAGAPAMARSAVSLGRAGWALGRPGLGVVGQVAALKVGLTAAQKGALRSAARGIWELRMGRSAASMGLRIHHRIPLEWSHLMPGNPNRVANLVGVTPGTHEAINAAWASWRAALGGRVPSASEIMKQALELDRRFGSGMTFLP